MVESMKLTALPRAERGTTASRRMRRQGLLPAVLYGHKEETVAVTLPLDELTKAIRHGVRVIDLDTGGKVEKALLREVQWDHLGKELLHVDFARVSADERFVVTVPIEVRGTAPGIAAGGLLEQAMHTLSVECLAINIPESIRVNVGELQVDGVITVKDLHLPEGVKAMSDPDAVVVQVVTPEAEAAAATPAEVASAEPEVIGRKVAAAGEEGE